MKVYRMFHQMLVDIGLKNLVFFKSLSECCVSYNVCFTEHEILKINTCMKN